MNTMNCLACAPQAMLVRSAVEPLERDGRIFIGDSLEDGITHKQWVSNERDPPCMKAARELMGAMTMRSTSSVSGLWGGSIPQHSSLFVWPPYLIILLLCATPACMGWTGPTTKLCLKEVLTCVPHCCVTFSLWRHKH